MRMRGSWTFSRSSSWHLNGSQNIHLDYVAVDAYSGCPYCMAATSFCLIYLSINLRTLFRSQDRSDRRKKEQQRRARQEAAAELRDLANDGHLRGDQADRDSSGTESDRPPQGGAGGGPLLASTLR